MSVFSQRLKEIMAQRDISQAQLCAMTGIPKSAMTQYLSACFEPKRGRLDTICRALNVNQSWLIGFSDCQASYGSVSVELSADEQRLIGIYRNNPKLKKEILELLSREESVSVFRAAKSEDGKAAPKIRNMSSEQLKRIADAPATDEDL